MTASKVAKKKAIKQKEIATDGPGIAESVTMLMEKADITLETLYFDYLNPQQNIFLKAYLTNGRNPLKSYREAYQNKMSDAAARVRGYQMLSLPGIKMALSELERQAQASLVVTLEDHVRRLRELGKLARDARQYSAAITAETNCGKAAGIYVTRMEHTGKDGAPIGLTNVPVNEYLEARQQILKDV